jgi:flagellar protein FlbD
MIKVTRLNKKIYYLNSELIETVESTPDTIITTVNGNKYVVRESVDLVVELVLEYKSHIFRCPLGAKKSGEA